MKWPNLLILVSGLTVIVSVALVKTKVADPSVIIVVTTTVSGLLGQLRGKAGDQDVKQDVKSNAEDVKVTVEDVKRMVNGELDNRIDARLVPAVEAVVERVIDVKLAPVLGRLDRLDGGGAPAVQT